MKGLFTSLLVFTMISLHAQSVRPITLDQLKQRFQTGTDTTYIVNFWATWCAPCVKEMPDFDRFQQDQKSQPVKVIFISMDFKSQTDKVIALVSRQKFISEVYLLEKKSEQEFIDQVSKNWEGAIPATLFVNNSRKIWKFYQQEFSYQELEKTYQFLK